LDSNQGPRDYEKSYPNEMAVFLRVFSLLRPVCKQVCKRVYVLRVQKWTIFCAVRCPRKRVNSKAIAIGTIFSG
jgi:hypothetical protein